MRNITPFLWFDHQAEDAVYFYLSIFPNSKKGEVGYYGEGAPLPAGTLMTISFELNGLEFMALNGGPVYTFSPATSFFVRCETQAEVDHYWDKLTDGGKPGPCGWLEDKYGVTWQIVPDVLNSLLNHPDPVKANKVLQAMFKMSKLDIAVLQQAAE